MPASLKTQTKPTLQIYLTSSVHLTAADIAKKIGRAKTKKLLYIYTACENKLGRPWQIRDKKALLKAGFTLIDYTLTGQTPAAIKKAIASADGFYFTGGNTFYLLQQIQLTKSASIIRNAVKAGKIYIGTSAGSIVAGSNIYPSYNLDNVKAAPKLKGYKGLGLTDLAILPHWGSKNFKAEYLGSKIAHNYNTKFKYLPLNDYQYLKIQDDGYRVIDVRKRGL